MNCSILQTYSREQRKAVGLEQGNFSGHHPDGLRGEQGGRGGKVPQGDGPGRRWEGLVRRVHGQVEGHVISENARDWSKQISDVFFIKKVFCSTKWLK